jgi:hydroxymethylpyrimidine kinase/phosphomethylpyrimidine kinase
MNREERVLAPVGLTIAGLDPTGGAGILADIKAFAAFGCIPTAAITSLTFQNASGVSGASHQTAETVRQQVMAIVAELPVAAVKTGMLPTREVVSEVARLVSEASLPAPIVDPALRSTSGYELMERDAINFLLSELMPLARVITPNIPEAEMLSGLKIENEEDMREAARKLRKMGARAVLIKGGHLDQRSEVRGRSSVRCVSQTVREGSRQAIDVLDDDGHVTVFRGVWIDAPPVRGTGCMLSAAIAAGLAKGIQLAEAVGAARDFVANEIQNSRPGTQK